MVISFHQRIAMFVVLTFCSTILHAAPLDDLKILLTDLKGWQAEKAEGAAMDMMGMKMTTATRSYEKGDKEFSAIIIVGTNSMIQGQVQSINAETDEVKVQTSDLDGFKVMQAYNKPDNTGYLVVPLHTGTTEGALLMIHFTGLEPAAGLAQAKKFNWQSIQKATAGLVK